MGSQLQPIEIGVGFLTRLDNGQFTVRDPETGEVFPLKGYGALKGQYEIRAGIDITKPIAAQAERLLSGHRVKA